MIPKIIHFCWLSGEEYPEKVKECIDSWHKHMPDYKFIKWTTANFDVNVNAYVKEAWECRKYAFVSDYIRLYSLYHYGGIYLDSDVMALDTFDKVLSENAFSGFEKGEHVAAWIFGSEQGNPIFKELMDDYEGRHFLKKDGSMNLTTNTIYVTNTLIKYGLKPEDRLQKLKNITIYPSDFFCPYDPWTNETVVTENTIAKHLFLGAWNTNADEDLTFIRQTAEFVEKYLKSRKSNRNILVYGAGIVGNLVIKKLIEQGSEEKINGIAVSKYDNDWRICCGKPIKMIEDVVEKDVDVIIATTPRYHQEIKETLYKNGFQHLYVLGER